MKSLNEDKAIRLDREAFVICRTEKINRRVRQGFPVSPSMCDIYAETCVGELQKYLTINSEVGIMILNTFVFADDQVSLAQEENNVQIPLQLLNNTIITYNSGASPAPGHN
jgi:hypothetical protein